MQGCSQSMWIRLTLVALWLGAVLVGASAASAASVESRGVRVTAVIGEASQGGTGLEQRAEVAEEEVVETAEAANVALLLDDDALAEMCENTRLRLSKLEGKRIVHIEAGEARIVVEPGREGEMLEIHTPVAIATIMGTVVYVTVDPVTGETTIASADHDVNVRSKNPNVAGDTTVTGGESTTISAGAAPQQKRKRKLKDLGTCLKDMRAASIATDRLGNELAVASAVANSDAGEAALADVGSGPSTPPGIGDPGGDPTSETGLLDPIDGNSAEDFESEPEGPVEVDPPVDFDFGF